MEASPSVPLGELPRGPSSLAGPSEASWREVFDKITPSTSYYRNALGTTAYYLLQGDQPAATAKDEEQEQEREHFVFVHGICTPAVGMLPLARHVLSNRPSSSVLLYDLWGHGLSSTPNVPHTQAIFLYQLLSLLGHMGWSRSKVHLVGFSLGGSIATSFSVHHASLVQSLFLVAPAGLLRHEADCEPALRSALRLENPDEKACLRAMFDFLGGGPDMDVPQDWQEKVNQGQVSSPALQVWQVKNHIGHERSVASIMRFGGVFHNEGDFILAAAAENKIPTMTVLGGKDGVCDPSRLKSVGFTDYKILPEATHALVRENVPEIASMIHTFIDTSPK